MGNFDENEDVQVENMDENEDMQENEAQSDN